MRSKITNKSASDKALDILSYRMRSEKELREKLAQYEFSPAQIDEAVKYVSGYGYLNDAVYAEQYVISKCGQKSPSKIAFELKNKGISEEDIENALAAIETSDEDTAYALLIKKISGAARKLDEKEKARLCRFLAGRGFASGVIYRAIKRYENDADSADVE